jgi:hypothetical protein
MPEWDEEVKRFMTHWFSGLMNGLESVDEPARTAILRECGKACARSYTAEVFQDARKRSADMEAFLSSLAVKFPEATYTQLTSRTIRVCYTQCACDLVIYGLVKSPLICECSAYNLQENFERALGISVTVMLETAILEGAPQCAFLVSLEER